MSAENKKKNHLECLSELCQSKLYFCFLSPLLNSPIKRVTFSKKEFQIFLPCHSATGVIFDNGQKYAKKTWFAIFKNIYRHSLIISSKLIMLEEDGREKMLNLHCKVSSGDYI